MKMEINEYFRYGFYDEKLMDGVYHLKCVTDNIKKLIFEDKEQKATYGLLLDKRIKYHYGCGPIEVGKCYIFRVKINWGQRVISDIYFCTTEYGKWYS